MKISCLLLPLVAWCPSATAFSFRQHREVVSTRTILIPSPSPFLAQPLEKRRSTTTSLHVTIGGALDLAKGATPLFSQLRRHANILLLLLTTLTILISKRNNLQTLFWPGAQYNDNQDSDAPLPPGSFGCPFLGKEIFSGSTDYGPYAGLGKLNKKYGNIFKLYTFGVPIVSVSGVDNIKSLSKNEFNSKGINTYMMGKKNIGPLFGEEALLYEGNAEKHGMLRRLVGGALTPAAIGAAIPSIQEAASVQISKVLEADTIQMEKVFSDYTLDIAWKQILGLDLEEEEVPEFHRAVEDWTGGIMNPMLLLPFKIPGLMRFTKVGRARKFLLAKVEEKLARLDRDGPDNATISKLYFATDDDGTTKLTRKQVIDNALLLIFAGTETSASTLTCASLILALNPDAWKKIKEEQLDICSEYGEDLTMKSLEQCVYLDAVIKETLRIKPLETAELRKVEETIVVDGNQIPKQWFVMPNIKQTHMNDQATYKEDGSHMDILKGFQPERWLDESTKPLAWMPFGDGRHRCIGERLSMTEMKIFLTLLARKVDYKLVNDGHDGIAWKTNTVMARPMDGVEVRAYAAA